MDIELVAPVVKRHFGRRGDWAVFHIFAGSQALQRGCNLSRTQGPDTGTRRGLGTAIRPIAAYQISARLWYSLFSGDEQLDIIKVGSLVDSSSKLPGDSLVHAICHRAGRYLVGEAASI